jgi:hypothetical protein
MALYGYVGAKSTKHAIRDEQTRVAWCGEYLTLFVVSVFGNPHLQNKSMLEPNCKECLIAKQE